MNSHFNLESPSAPFKRSDDPLILGHDQPCLNCHGDSRLFQWPEQKQQQTKQQQQRTTHPFAAKLKKTQTRPMSAKRRSPRSLPSANRASRNFSATCWRVDFRTARTTRPEVPRPKVSSKSKSWPIPPVQDSIPIRSGRGGEGFLGVPSAQKKKAYLESPSDPLKMGSVSSKLKGSPPGMLTPPDP